MITNWAKLGSTINIPIVNLNTAPYWNHILKAAFTLPNKKKMFFSILTDLLLFQAQIEIQSMMEENTYPLFLKSDLYLEYTRTGGESPKPNPSEQSPSSGQVKAVAGYLPTLAEDEEWR